MKSRENKERKPMSATAAANRPVDKPFRVYPDIPPDVHAKLKVRAKKNFRSVRAEIAAIVEDAIAAGERAEQEAQELELK
jgi:Arc-like DNA binding domain